MLHNQTKFIYEEDGDKKWFLFDAKDVVVGRLAAEISKILRGKHKPTYTPTTDNGDFVIVINAKDIHLTGNKLEQEFHRWHTGHPGGLKERTMKQLLTGAHPERVMELAVQRMMPKTKLGTKQFKKLRVYSGAEHPHEAQQPTTIDFAAAKPQNVKRG
jgi:large subunit ribosomal protein L13